jgi:hypothetical protein
MCSGISTEGWMLRDDTHQGGGQAGARLACPQMFQVYLMWRKQPWFIEKERGYNYDRHFQPGGMVEDHYREWAATRGMKVGYISDLPPEAREAILKAKEGA